MHIGIIGDIINSKKIKNRDEVQIKLKSILNSINDEYKDSIAANFIITLGDEFQGLLTSPEKLMEIIDKIRIEIYPIKIRFGIGIGEIVTEINKEMAIGADGPAYHIARKMIDDLKVSNKANSKISTSGNIKISLSNYNIIIELINSNLNLCELIEDRWSEKQRELISKIIYKKISQREVAEEIGITQSSVQRRLKSSGYYDYLNSRNTINRALAELWGEYCAD